tara:strand:+ start:5332 stop:5562 length:231 start_codon:yes stop_codon:yes gene_type:complete
MFNIFNRLKEFVVQLTNLVFVIFCLGVILQLIMGEPILGWDVVGNISKTLNSLGQSTFLGVLSILVLYHYFSNYSK